MSISEIELYLIDCSDIIEVFYLQVLNNIELYLQEEERRMIKQDQECKYNSCSVDGILMKPKTAVIHKE